MLEHKADVGKRDSATQDESQESMDVTASLNKIKDQEKHGSAVMRASRFRKNCNFLSENSVK